MRFSRLFGFGLLVVGISLTAGEFSQTQAQKAPRRGAKAATATAKPTVAQMRGRVAEQLKLMTQFLYLYGRSSKDLEMNERQARSTQLPESAQAALNRNRETLQTSLQNIRDGLNELEITFRSDPRLKKYYEPLSGVGAEVTDAQDLAAQGQYDQAGRLLLGVVNQLTDTLAGMP